MPGGHVRPVLPKANAAYTSGARSGL